MLGRLSLRAGRLFNPATVTAATIAAAVALFFIEPPLFEVIELNWLDLRFRARGPLAPGPGVVIAAIDEKSIEAEGRWPWRRSRIGALIDALAADGAKVIAVDVLFSEPVRDGRLALVEEIARGADALKIDSPELQHILRQSRAAADDDRMLVEALRRSAAPVVLGYFFHIGAESAGSKPDAGEMEQRLEAIATSKYPLVYRSADSGAPPFIKAHAPQANLGRFAEAAAASGHFSLPTDADGVVRWMPLALQAGEDLYAPLAIMSAWHYLGKPPLAVRSSRYGIEGVELGERFIPTDEQGQLLINYRGPPHTFRAHSVADILGGKLPKGTFKERIVVVGATAIGVGDVRNTPFGPVYPGPEIHASAIDNILAGDFIDRPRWSRVFDLFAIVGLALMVGLALPRTSALLGLLTAVALAVAFVLGAHWLFVERHVWLNMVYPVFALAATYTMLTLYRYITEERERRRLKEAFQHYVAPDVIELMLKDPGGVHLGGHEAVLTAVISDLEGFTGFSERHAPHEIIGVLGDYYAEMTEQIFVFQGTLVEYVGDEIFALFGAPMEQPDHAKRACASALAMRERRAALGDAWTKSGRPRLKARTGITTGTMLVGNIGSKYRFHYGAMGDPVNLASRLEGLGRVYGAEIVISDHTAQMVEGSFQLRALDLVRVKGRQQALAIHELLGAADAALPVEQKEMLALYAAAMTAYRGRRWDEALELFRQCLVLWPEDGPARLMARRCTMFRDDPPPADWGGMFEHLTK